MALITGITGAAADSEEEVRLTTEPAAEIEDRPELEPAPEEASAEPGPGFAERSYVLVGRAMRFVMQTMIPSAWQLLVQEMAEQLPAKISLVPAEELVWQHDEEYQVLLEDLHDQGFVDAGIFRADTMKTQLHLLVNEVYDIRAVVYEHENSGVVLDLVTLFGDGTGVTYVNRSDPGIEQSPLHPNTYLGDVPVFELLDICLRERPKKARLPVTRASAARLMELEYEIGAKRLRGVPVNPVEIADAYLEVITGPAKSDAEEESATPVKDIPPWTGRHETVIPSHDEAIGMVAAEPKPAPPESYVQGKLF